MAEKRINSHERKRELGQALGQRQAVCGRLAKRARTRIALASARPSGEGCRIQKTIQPMSNENDPTQKLTAPWGNPSNADNAFSRRSAFKMAMAATGQQ